MTTAHDFGHVEQGTAVTVAYALRNTGGLDLSIDNLRTGCDCTTAAPSPRRLPPRAAGAITVRFDTAEQYGPQTKTISVYSNDPEHAVTTLTLTGTVDADLAALPPQLYIGHVHRGDPAPDTVRLVGSAATRIDSGPLDGGDSILAARVAPAAGNGAEREVRVAAKADAPLGPFVTAVQVQTGSARRPLLDITVAGIVDGDVTVSPGELHFGNITRGAANRRVLAVRSRTSAPVHITARLVPSAGAAPPGTPLMGVVDLIPIHPGQEYRVQVTLDAVPPARAVHGALEIHTDAPDQPTITVPISGRIVAR